MCKATITPASKLAIEMAITELERELRMSSDEFLRRREAGEFSFELIYQHWDHLLACREMMSDEPDEPVVAETKKLIASTAR